MANQNKARFLAKHKKEQEKSIDNVNNRFPKFSFEFCFASNRGIHKADGDTQKAVIKKIINLSQCTWQDIKDLPREQGFEKIEKSSFNSLPSVPNKFNDQEKVVVFRLPNKQGRLMGYIEEDTFFVVWIDTKFDMYNH
ncbi:hypothetical protein [Moritella yayanosii]|uniref:Uncharacterized protein n=1 Tax=Moritella yayanosii TaxID=69539 RepID=A0A330LW98_9GAMM|nr:hypothetical protein [Moritella yayanosii]SQD78355.1 protein of unknown function [Moritella yayanosii]